MGGNWTPATFGGEAGRFGDVSTRKTKRNEHGDSLSPGFAHIRHLAICLLDESATGKGVINDAVCPHGKRAFSGEVKGKEGNRRQWKRPVGQNAGFFTGARSVWL